MLLCVPINKLPQMGALFRYIILASLLVLSVRGSIMQRSVQQDPCSFPTNRQVFDVKEILDCYNGIPADAKRIESTLASLRQLIQTYSFTDIAKANLEPYNINVDLAAELDKIAQATWTNDYAFHMALSRLFNQLNDANTMYYAPSPYLECVGIKPFALFPSSANFSTEDVPINLVVNRLVNGSNVKWNWPIDPSQYSGLQVTQINGQEPRDYLMAYADHVGTYKDVHVRFNHLFDLVGWSVIDPFTFPISDIPNEVLTVLNADGSSANVKVPVKMFCEQLSFSSTKDMITQIDTPLPLNNDAAGMFDSSPDLRQERLRLVEALRPSQNNLRAEAEVEENLSVVERFGLAVARLNARDTPGTESIELVTKATDNSIYLFALLDNNGNSVPVLKVVSFAPAENSVSSWLNTAVGFNRVLTDYGFSYGIVDVNKNGGGTVCLSLLLQALMDHRIAGITVDTEFYETLWTPYNVRKSRLFDEIYNSGVQGLDEAYVVPDYGTNDDPSSFYQNETHTVLFPNNVKSNLTKFIFLPRSCDYLLLDYLTSFVYVFPENLIITTDGSCGGACALYMAKLTKLGKGQIVSIGGDTKYNRITMRTASFIGGNVVEWSDMNKYTNLTTPFTTSARARFNWHQTFSSISYDQYPLEYNYTAFEPTDVLRSWKMVVNDDPSTEEGQSYLAETYGAVVSLWGDYNQTMFPGQPMSLPPTYPPLSKSTTPVSTTTPSPIASPSVPVTSPVTTDMPTAAPYNIPSADTPSISSPVGLPIDPSTGPVSAPINSPSSSTNGPDTNSSTVTLWVIIFLVAIAAVVGSISAIVFGIKYAQMKKLLGDEGRARLLPYVE